MAYIPETNSVVAFQSDPTKLVGTVSVVGVLPVTQSGTVISSISGLVDIAGSVMAVITGTPAVSVQGTVFASIIGIPSISGTVNTIQSGVRITSISGIPQVEIIGSVATTITPPANQSVSGTVHIDNFSSVVSYQLAGSILATSATLTPVANQSVSGTVEIGNFPASQNINGSVIARNIIPSSLLAGVSVIGLTPVNVSNFPTNQSVSGAVDVANFPTSQNINGSVISYQLAGSILATSATVNPVANQSVSGTIGASIIGLPPVNGNVASGILDVGNPVKVGAKFNASVITFLDLQRGDLQIDSTGNLKVVPIQGTSVSGTVNIGNLPTSQNVSGSVVAFQGGTQITSLVSTVPSSVLIGVSVFGLAPVNVTNTNLNVGGSVVGFQGGTWIASVFGNMSVIGTVPVTQATSEWTVKSSLAGGIFPVSGSVAAVVTNFPTNQNVSGSVIAQIASSVLVVGPIATTQSGTWKPSVINYATRNDTVASFLGADLTYSPQASDSAGRALIKPFASEEARIEGYASVVSTSVTTLVAAAGAGLRNYITDFFIVNTGATTTLITFKDGAGSILGYTIAPTGGGSNAPGLTTPIRTGANASFDFQPTTASSILYATVKGFKAP